jgi:hypothetical protein
MTAHRKSELPRRGLLKQCLYVPMGFLLAKLGVSESTAADATSVCFDPKLIDAAQKTARDSLHYSEASSDPTKICSGCSFFQSGVGACGHCAIFNGPTNINGHCDSWNAKD